MFITVWFPSLRGWCRCQPGPVPSLGPGGPARPARSLATTDSFLWPPFSQANSASCSVLVLGVCVWRGILGTAPALGSPWPGEEAESKQITTGRCGMGCRGRRGAPQEWLVGRQGLQGCGHGLGPTSSLCFPLKAAPLELVSSCWPHPHASLRACEQRHWARQDCGTIGY